MSPSSSPRRPRVRRALGSLAAALALGAPLAIVGGSPLPAAAASHDFADPIFSADARGDITTIGNVTTTCDPTYANANWSAAESAAACNGSRSGATGTKRFDGADMPPINNRMSMVYVDTDKDTSTFSSSLARLQIPSGSTVLWAGLHWNAATDVPRADQLYGSSHQVPPVSTADRFEVRFATPASNGYVPLVASPADGTTRDTWDDTNPGGTVSYGGYVDVTKLVKAGGSGAYSVADVQSCQGFGGCFGSWSLTVAFANASMPPRNLNVWHGWQLTTPTVNKGAQEFTVNSITPPPKGPVSARIGVVQADGDRGLGPDSLDISSPSSPTWTTFSTADRPLASGEDDWFNSTVNAYGRRRATADATPNYLANLDQDIALVENDAVIHNSDTSFRFRIQTASTESLYSQVVHSAVDLYEPEIAIDKTVAPAGPVPVGTEVTWTLEISNAGIDPVRHAVVTDPLPTGVTYVPGSVSFASGGPATILGTKTDATGDDQVDWDSTSRQLAFRVGAGADEDDGGTMGIAPAADGSHTVTITFRTTVDAPAGTVVTNEAKAHGEGRSLDDPYGPMVTEAKDLAPIATAPEADLGITKTDDDAVVRKVGDRFTYRLEATNGGPSPATGVTMTDELDPMITFAASADGCTASGQDVTCAVGDLAVGAKASRSFEVEVVSLPGPGKEVPNLAAVKGNEPNPDCKEPTPRALCNEDDEKTPQPEVDLGITKTDGDAVLASKGDRYTYTLQVTNAGPDDATGVTVTDDLDPMIRFAQSEGCTAAGQAVTCDVGDLESGASSVVEVTVEVVELPAIGKEIPNLAAVKGNEPDPDCTDETPKALCNSDDETTPRTPPAGSPSPTSAVPGPATPAGPAPAGPIVRTGADTTSLLAIGMTLIGGGGAVLVTRRRSRRLHP